MSAVTEPQARPLFRPLRQKAPPAPARPRGWWRYGIALVLAGYLLFAHGCHGDEDNELFAWLGSNPARGHRLDPRALLPDLSAGYHVLVRGPRRHVVAWAAILLSPEPAP